MYIHRDRAGPTHLCSRAEQTSLAVGGRDGCQWASSVCWEWSGVGQRECWWGRGSSRHGSCQVRAECLCGRASVEPDEGKTSTCDSAIFPGLRSREPTQPREPWMSSLSCWRNMAREDLAWKMSPASPTTTASSSLTGRRPGCWKHRGSTGQRREWEVIRERILNIGAHLKCQLQKVLYCLCWSIISNNEIHKDIMERFLTGEKLWWSVWSIVSRRREEAPVFSAGD